MPALLRPPVVLLLAVAFGLQLQASSPSGLAAAGKGARLVACVEHVHGGAGAHQHTGEGHHGMPVTDGDTCTFAHAGCPGCATPALVTAAAEAPAVAPTPVLASPSPRRGHAAPLERPPRPAPLA